MTRLLFTRLAPLLLAAVVLVGARSFPGAVEARYARELYPRLAEVLGRPAALWARAFPSSTGHPAPSLSEVLILVLAVLGLALAVRTWRRRAEERVSLRLARVALGALLAGGALVLVFALTWGLNHARRPLLDGLGWERPTAGAAELGGLARWLADEAGALRAELPEDADGIVRIPADLFERVGAAWARAAAARPLLAGPAPLLREPVASPILTAARVSGIFSPFTGESHVAGDQPAEARGFTALHEVAHRRGWAREDEANALAFLVGVETGDPYLRYSACAVTLGMTLRWLLVLDPEAAAAVVDTLHDGHVRDIEASRAFWSRERSTVVRSFGVITTRTNDAYLRSMGSVDGIASYGRMVDVALAWWLRR